MNFCVRRPRKVAPFAFKRSEKLDIFTAEVVEPRIEPDPITKADQASESGIAGANIVENVANISVGWP